MIVASFSDVALYEASCPGLVACVNEICRLIETNAENGRYELEGGSYVAVSSYETTSPDVPQYENHHAYIDVQVLSEGRELLLVGDAVGTARTRAYQPDIEFYAEPSTVHALTLAPGCFAVLFPGEAHAPGIAFDRKPTQVKKLVGKIPVR